jgi:hypothetical protein
MTPPAGDISKVYDSYIREVLKMVKYFCDICGAEMSREDRGRIKVRRGRVSVEIMTALDNRWNDGQICHNCIVDVVVAYGERSSSVYKLENDHVLTFFPADPNMVGKSHTTEEAL